MNTIRSREWRPEGGSISRGQSVTITEGRCRRCGAIGDFMLRNGYCPEHLREIGEDKMIGEGRLLFDGFGVYNRPRPHVEAFVENQIDAINKRRRGQGKPEIKGKLDVYGRLGICVDVSIMKRDYCDVIRECLGGPTNYDPRHIEAYMRLEHSTLDALSREQFEQEVAIAVSCIDTAGDVKSESLAQSFGL